MCTHDGGHLDPYRYARGSLLSLPDQQQTDLLDWVEAHSALAFIARQEEGRPGLLERLASHAPASWAKLALCARTALDCGCTDIAHYAMVADAARLRAAVSSAESDPSLNLP